MWSYYLNDKLFDYQTIQDSPIVQLVERRTVNPYVAGSSPAWGAI